MSSPFPSLTKVYHHTTHTAIDPSRLELSARGKVIAVTGGRAGIGLAIAHSFAKAGASSIALLGRTDKTLRSAKENLEADHKDVKVLTAVADIVNKSAVDKAFSTIKSDIGPIDIFVNNAGYLPNLTSVRDSDIEEWFSGFEINVKGSMIVTKVFLDVAAPDPVLINLTTGGVHIPPIPGYSSYAVSKLAALNSMSMCRPRPQASAS